MSPCLFECPKGTTGRATINRELNGVSQFCEDCQSGKYMDEQGVDSSTACKNCLSGQYGVQPRSDLCLDCPRNTYSASDEAFTCSTCPPGKHTVSTASDSLSDCVLCAPGDVYVDLSTGCQACQPGMYSGANDIACMHCSRGTYQDQSGGSSCKNCTPGFFRPSELDLSLIHISEPTRPY